MSHFYRVIKKNILLFYKKTPNTLRICRDYSNSSTLDYFNECSSNLTSVNLRNCYLNDTILTNDIECDIQNLIDIKKYQISSIKYVFEYLNPTGITKANLDIYFFIQNKKHPMLLTKKWDNFYRQDYDISFLRVGMSDFVLNYFLNTYYYPII